MMCPMKKSYFDPFKHHVLYSIFYLFVHNFHDIYSTIFKLKACKLQLFLNIFIKIYFNQSKSIFFNKKIIIFNINDHQKQNNITGV